MTVRHEPREQIRGIQQILVSDKKRIGFLFGAGTSFATGTSVSVPAVAKMTAIVVEEIVHNAPAFTNALKELKSETELAHATFTVETLLSTLEAKRTVIGAGKLNGMSVDG